MGRVGALGTVIFVMLASLCLRGANAASQASEGSQADVLRELLSGIQISGFWHHGEEKGSEWQLTVRDPEGELFSGGSAAAQPLASAGKGAQPSGASQPPKQSLLLDVSRPLAEEGPDTLLMQASDTALGRGTGLQRLLARLGLTDAVMLSASPDLENLNLAYGVRKAFPSVFGFRSPGWAHYLIASAQFERLSPEEGTAETSLLGSVSAFLGRGARWRDRPLEPQMYAAIESALKEAEADVAGDPGKVALALLKAAEAAGWGGTGAELKRGLASSIGPGRRRYGEYLEPANKPSVEAFLQSLRQSLQGTTEFSMLAPEVQDGDVARFLETRLKEAWRRAYIAGDVYELMSVEKLTREEAFARAEEPPATAPVSLAALIDAAAPGTPAAYWKVAADRQPVGDLPENVRQEVFLGFISVPPAPWPEWRSAVLSYVTAHAVERRPRFIFAVDVAAFGNEGSEVDGGGYVDARLIWRPDPFRDYGLNLSHKQGKEESNRERRVNWTALEFSYVF